MSDALTFLKRLSGGGAIVPSSVCSTMEIAYAQADGRFFVDSDHLGYVLRFKEWRELAEKTIHESGEDAWKQ